MYRHNLVVRDLPDDQDLKDGVDGCARRSILPVEPPRLLELIGQFLDARFLNRVFGVAGKDQNLVADI